MGQGQAGALATCHGRTGRATPLSLRPTTSHGLRQSRPVRNRLPSSLPFRSPASEVKAPRRKCRQRARCRLAPGGPDLRQRSRDTSATATRKKTRRTRKSTSSPAAATTTTKRIGQPCLRRRASPRSRRTPLLVKCRRESPTLLPLPPERQLHRPRPEPSSSPLIPRRVALRLRRLRRPGSAHHSAATRRTATRRTQ